MKKRGNKGLIRGNVPKPETNKRIPVEEVDVLGYDKLIGKLLMTMTKKYGKKIFPLREDLVSVCYEALLKAKQKYDPTRGTFVTLAYLRLYTALDRYISNEFKHRKHEVISVGDPDQTGGNADYGFFGHSLDIEDDVEGSILDPERILEYFKGTGKEKYVLALVDEWDNIDFIGEFGKTREQCLPMLQEVADEICELCFCFVGGTPAYKKVV